MRTIQNLIDLFDLLHDGVIVSATENGSDIELGVGIQYLAELINKDFEFLFVKLINVQNLTFEAWTDEPLSIINSKEIFNLKLEILSGESDEAGNIIVHCRCFNALNNLFSGGKLILKFDDFEILDESLTPWTLNKLKELVDHYWNDNFGKN